MWYLQYTATTVSDELDLHFVGCWYMLLFTCVGQSRFR